MIINYSNVQISLWWIFHLSVVFWGVSFPFHYDRQKKKGNLKKVGIILSIAGLLAPILTVIITVAHDAVIRRQGKGVFSDSLGYSDYQHLPIFCAPTHVSLYTQYLPLILSLAGGGPVIFLVFLRFYQVSMQCYHTSINYLFCLLQKRSTKACTTEIKLIVVLCYYILLASASIIDFAYISENTDALHESTVNYFYCKSRGEDPNNPCPRDFEEFDVAIVTACTLIILSLYPLYVLMFAINFQEILKFFHRKRNPNISKTDSLMLR